MTSASPSMTTRPATMQTVLKLTRRVPARLVLGLADASSGGNEAIRSCGEVNDLIVWLFGEALPAVDFVHGNLAGGEQRPEQHGGGFIAGQHGLGLESGV